MTAATGATRPARPYPGLRPFEAHEWSIFFGRERMIDDVIARLADHRLIVIHGASGSGKSSLVRAGVMPKLARQYLRHGEPWMTCAMRPSGGPLWNLATELARLERHAENHTGDPADDIARIESIAASFSRREATLAAVVGAQPDMAGKSLCILVDQFEELFRFEKETSREEAELFIDLLSRAVPAGEGAPAPEADVRVVVTMRSEFLGECARFAGLAETINLTQYLVPRMDDEAIHRAVMRPAQLFRGEVPQPLADRLIASVRGREDELPVLQHGLMLMWDEAVAKDEQGKPEPGRRIVLDGAAVEAAGGLAGRLSTHADAVMADAAPDEAHARRVELLFRELTDVNAEGSAIRRPRSFRDLLAVIGGPPEDLRAIIDAFRDPGVSFLVPYAPDPITDATIIDISHEALIRCWRRVASAETGWLKKEFDDGLAWRSLRAEADAFARDSDRVLSPAATKERSALAGARNEAWSLRYGGGWEAVNALLQASRQAASNARYRVNAMLFGFVVLAATSAISALYWKNASEEAEAARQAAEIQIGFSNSVLSQLATNEAGCPKVLASPKLLFNKAEQSAQNDYKGATSILGFFYGCGIGTRQDYYKARELYTKAAKAGDATAMTSMGLLFANGRGTDQDYSKARDWYEKAAETGYVDAMLNIALLYANGQGTSKDDARAQAWFERAVTAGGPDVMRNIGALYAKGRGVAQDYAKAREWYEKGVEHGDSSAMRGLAEFYRYGNGVEKSYSQAITLYEQMGKAGEAIGFISASWLSVLQKDYQRALSDSKQAIEVDQSSVLAQTNYAHALMLLGRPTEARAVYLENRNKNLPGDDLWQQLILDDFKKMQKEGISHSLMEEITQTFEADIKDRAR